MTKGTLFIFHADRRLLFNNHENAMTQAFYTRASDPSFNSPPPGLTLRCHPRLERSWLGRRIRRGVWLTALAGLALGRLSATAQVFPSEDLGSRGSTVTAWDTFSDTWVATDALERHLPLAVDVGPPRPERSVGIFYFLWLGPHVNGGPYDITRILAQDPTAMQNPASPLWGPLHAPHHWGQSKFGYYLTHDPYVLRKHAQMLADAGIDTLIFDVTNQVTYKENYLALLKVFSEIGKNGGKTPQVAFLCPFWDPAKVAAELYRDLYGPGLYPELWYRWEGKPLILADPAQVGSFEGNTKQETPTALEAGHTLGQSFTVDTTFDAVGGRFPTWNTKASAVTLTLYRATPREPITTQKFDPVEDNAWLMLRLPATMAAGEYYLEASAPVGKIGWWSHSQDVLKGGQAWVDGSAAVGDRTLRISVYRDKAAAIRNFFTFRKPQADYFRGPTGPNMWSWLEVYPQHVFLNQRGEKEQMSVGVAQNAVNGRLATLSAPGAHGRSFHGGAFDPTPGAERRGYNFAEQWARALEQDPKFIFITGWNEWIAGRFDEFNGVKMPVMFVDTFDQEHSRDIEPMRGGHGDDYYYQMVSYIRRFKGVRPSPVAGAPKTIRLEEGFGQWADVLPEFRDDIGDTAHRDFPGYNNCARYVDQTGRNDLTLLKVARDDRFLYFYARTQSALTSATDPQWMLLYIDADANHQTGWEGYDFRIQSVTPDGRNRVLERKAGAGTWERVSELPFFAKGNELHLAVDRESLGLASSNGRLKFDFKWADNIPNSTNILDFIDHGDVAPNGRFNYRYQQSNPVR